MTSGFLAIICLDKVCHSVKLFAIVFMFSDQVWESPNPVGAGVPYNTLMFDQIIVNCK